MPLFQVAFMKKAVVSAGTNQVLEPEKLLFGPETVVAADVTAAIVAACQKNETLKDVDPTTLQTIVKQFGA